MKTPLDILLPYQRDWVQDTTRFKIGLWSRQTGKSFACACEIVKGCIEKKGSFWVILSAGERQALEFMEKVKQWTEAFSLAIHDYREERANDEALLKSAEVRFANGSRVLALPANPNTARGYSANLVLDEFAFHEKPNEIWRGIYPSISNPLKGEFKLRIVSTANGKTNKFYDLWEKNPQYSKHLVNIYKAKELGLPIDIEALKEGLDDPDGWAQEYECKFIDNSSVLLPYDLLATAEDKEVKKDIDHYRLEYGSEHFYLGVDVGRKHDLTVLWLLQKVGDVLFTRGVIEFSKTKYKTQEEFIANLLLRYPRIRRVAIDATGIGSMLAENLAERFGKYRVDECQFTQSFKEEIFTKLRSRFDDRNIRIPVSRVIREDLHGLQKVTTASGTVRYLAPHNEDGHCDRATALALASYASETYTVPADPQSISGHRSRYNQGMASLRRERTVC